MELRLEFGQLVVTVSGADSPRVNRRRDAADPGQLGLDLATPDAPPAPRRRGRPAAEPAPDTDDTTAEDTPPEEEHQGPSVGGRIREALQEAGGPLSVNTLATKTGASWHIVNRVSTEMVEAGLLVRAGDGDNGQGKAKLLWLVEEAPPVEEAAE